MKTINMTSHQISHRVVVCGLLTVLCGALPLCAQVPAPKFKVSAQRVDRQPNGNVRLEGKAHIQTPEVDVKAQSIALDITGNQVTQVRAQNQVAFKLDLPAKDGGAPAHVEATCDAATLNPLPRTLLLSGNVSGWYQVGGGARNTLSGDSATIKYVGKDLMVDVNGGTRGVSISIPAEKDNPAAIGTVTLTAQRATFNNNTGVATFTGKARAVSTDGPNKFDVAAPAFILTRGAGGAIDRLTTSGRTQIKIDLPPEPAAAKPADAAASTIPEIGRPTHVEAEADGVVVRRATNTMDFQGNVKGFYELAAPGATATKYDFVGDRVAIKYVMKDISNAAIVPGLKVEMIGVPVEINAPAFNLSF